MRLKPTSECNFTREQSRGAEEMADAAVLRGVCLPAHLRCHLSFAQFSARKGQSDGGREGLVGSVKNSQSPLGPRVTSSLASWSPSLGRSLTYLSLPAPFARSAVPPPPSVALAVKTSGHSFSGAPFPLRPRPTAAMYSVARSGRGRKVSRLWQGWVGMV